MTSKGNLCEYCKKYFPEQELDMYKGYYICLSCEEYLTKDEGDDYEK